MDQAGLEIPFPQRTVWLRHEDGQDTIDAPYPTVPPAEESLG